METIGDPGGVLIADEARFVKAGIRSANVQRAELRLCVPGFRDGFLHDPASHPGGRRLPDRHAG
jgi:hypothetical protein